MLTHPVQALPRFMCRFVKERDDKLFKALDEHIKYEHQLNSAFVQKRGNDADAINHPSN